MAQTSLSSFFSAAAGVAGALIGLLFVALSVVNDRSLETQTVQSHRLRAGVALAAFVNALGVSLFSLIYGPDATTSAIAFAIVGLGSVAGSTIAALRDGSLRLTSASNPIVGIMNFILPASLAAVFTAQIFYAAVLSGRHGALPYTRHIATLVVICFLIGIIRSWELIDGPAVGFLRALHSSPPEAGSA